MFRGTHSAAPVGRVGPRGESAVDLQDILAGLQAGKLEVVAERFKAVREPQPQGLIGTIELEARGGPSHVGDPDAARVEHSTVRADHDVPRRVVQLVAEPDEDRLGRMAVA